MSGEVVVLLARGGVWFDGLTLVGWLREKEREMESRANHPAADRVDALSALAMADAVRQVADHLVTSQLAALDGLDY